jgi:hypothetical protein
VVDGAGQEGRETRRNWRREVYSSKVGTTSIRVVEELASRDRGGGVRQGRRHEWEEREKRRVNDEDEREEKVRRARHSWGVPEMRRERSRLAMAADGMLRCDAESRLANRRPKFLAGGAPASHWQPVTARAILSNRKPAPVGARPNAASTRARSCRRTRRYALQPCRRQGDWLVLAPR